MKLLEFMQPFDGNQPELTPEEQARAAELFRGTIGDAMIKHAGHVAYAHAALIGDNAPQLELFPVAEIPDLRKADVGISYNDGKPAQMTARIHFDHAEHGESIVFYSSKTPEAVTRIDVSDPEANRILPTHSFEDVRENNRRYQESQANMALEREYRLNDCLVGEAEVSALGALLMRMEPAAREA
jgi:hypothetical protein